MNHTKETPMETPQNEDSLKKTAQTRVSPSLPRKTPETQETPVLAGLSKETQETQVFSGNAQETPLEIVFAEETPKTGVSFEDFYAIYPRKSAKGKARKAWDKLTEENKKAAIAGAERFAKDPNREDLWTPYPATWLNAEQWEDEPLPPLKLSPEASREAEKVRAREKDRKEREAAESLARLEEAAREKAVPMPDYLKDLLRRV
jgi:hypothetical protein